MRIISFCIVRFGKTISIIERVSHSSTPPLGRSLASAFLEEAAALAKACVIAAEVEAAAWEKAFVTAWLTCPLRSYSLFASVTCRSMLLVMVPLQRMPLRGSSASSAKLETSIGSAALFCSSSF